MVGRSHQSLHVARRIVAALLVCWPGVAVAQAPGPNAALDSARVALAKYADPFAAIRDGYFSTLACIEYPEGGTLGDELFAPGGMGVHFLNMAYVGQQPDPAHPQVLIYQPVRDTLQLVAAEWFVPAQASPTAPHIFGQTLKGPMHGHEPIMPPELHHYDLHVWLWKANPAGVFSSTNPNVHCPNGRYTIRNDQPSLVHSH